MDVPIRRDRHSVADIHEAYELVNRLYARLRPQRPDRSRGKFTAQAMSAGALAIDRIRNAGLRGATEAEPFDHLSLCTLISGQLHCELSRSGPVRLSLRDTFLHPRHESVTAEWTDADLLLLRLPWSEISFSAAALFDLDAGVPLRFTSSDPVSGRWSTICAALATMAYREMRAPDSALSNALVHREMVDTLLTAVVLTFPNTTMTRGYLPGPGDVQPSAVRRAAAFIGANASLPINLTDIARSAGTTPRAIRVAFRRHLDTTPSEYLRRERLAAAHHDLQAADPTRGTTVAQIALRWGFPDPSRFTNAYRAAYGTPPGHTLGK